MTQSPYTQQLIDACRSGQPAAMNQLYALAWPVVYPAVQGIVKQREEAEDIMQEGFLKGFGRLGELREPEAYPAWQRSICVRLALNRIRGTRHFMSSVDDVADTLADATDTTPLPDPEDLIRLLDRLPEGQALVIRLRLAEGMSHDEISQNLGIHPSAARSQYSRGLEKLRTLIAKEYV